LFEIEAVRRQRRVAQSLHVRGRIKRLQLDRRDDCVFRQDCIGVGELGTERKFGSADGDIAVDIGFIDVFADIGRLRLFLVVARKDAGGIEFGDVGNQVVDIIRQRCRDQDERTLANEVPVAILADGRDLDHVAPGRCADLLADDLVALADRSAGAARGSRALSDLAGGGSREGMLSLQRGKQRAAHEGDRGNAGQNRAREPAKVDAFAIGGAVTVLASQERRLVAEIYSGCMRCWERALHLYRPFALLRQIVVPAPEYF